MIAAGARVWLSHSGHSYTVGRLLGEGSQGGVYELVRDDAP